MTDGLLPVPPLTDPVNQETVGKYRVAMVINGVVHNILTLGDEDAARFLSNPEFVQIPKTLFVETGATYDGTTFTPPVTE